MAENATPPELKEEATKAKESILPAKTKKQYVKAYENFKKWCSSKKTENYLSANVILAYIQYLHTDKKFKASTIWSTLSKIKKTISLLEGKELNYDQVYSYLKEVGKGQETKKSATFTKDQINTFLLNATNGEFLHVKFVINFNWWCSSSF